MERRLDAVKPITTQWGRTGLVGHQNRLGVGHRGDVLSRLSRANEKPDFLNVHKKIHFLVKYTLLVNLWESLRPEVDEGGG